MRKVLTAFFLITLLISNIYISYAADEVQENDLVQLKFKEHCGELFKTQEMVPNYSYVTYEKDGKEFPVYCLNNDLAGVSEGYEYPVNVTGRIENEYAWKVIINGYPYKTPEELGVANKIEAFVATKLAVNMALNENYEEDKYTALDTEESRRVISAFKRILESAQNTSVNMENDLSCSIVPESENWTVDSINAKCISKTYEIKSKIASGTYSIELMSDASIDGLVIVDLNNNPKTIFDLNEKFKLIIPIEKLNESKKFTIKSEIVLDTMPILYGATTVDGMQNYALTGEKAESTNCILDDNTIKNITKLVIIKKEYNSETRLQGVKFSLLDENREIVRENLITNENGEIIIDNILPGKYYLKEIETLEKYNLYTDLIEVNINFNEDLKIVVNNELKEVLEIKSKDDSPKTNETTNKIVDQKTETIELNEINNIKRLPVTGY